MSDGQARFAPWILGIVAAILVIGIGSGTAILFKLNASVEVLSSKVDTLNTVIAEKTADRYTASDASRDRTALYQMISSNQDRISKLEATVQELRLKDAKREGRSERIGLDLQDHLAGGS